MRPRASILENMGLLENPRLLLAQQVWRKPGIHSRARLLLLWALLFQKDKELNRATDEIVRRFDPIGT